MSGKRILVLNGHPAARSLSKEILKSYASAAEKSGHEVRMMHLHDLEFDMDFGVAQYVEKKPLESDLLTFQAQVEWAEHIVLSTPMWWGGVPAKLKGLFDRALLPGWAFDPRTLKMGMPMPLLTGRTARIFVTSDTPDFFFGLLYRKALFRQLKGQIFKFVGITPAKITHFASAGKAGPDKVETWLTKASALGQQGA
ncbi:NAD(P)H-dependent oxidoreductase [Planktotalea sp.]|uniref:NAD(P)H-dependent oxidoreductase n=1 Tax=Planktotalea sp. TaxID=2029877 RepID=UPI003298941A